MASTGLEAVAPVLAAVKAMTSSDRVEKTQATAFLEKFQKTPDSWQVAYTILLSDGADAASQQFAATTLKGKLPRETLPSLRDFLLTALKKYQKGPRPIRIQLCICLAHLAIQMLEWKNVLETVVSTLQNEPAGLTCIFDFLRILPEEVTEGKKIQLSEDELLERSRELLSDNAETVVRLLTNYAASSSTAAQDPQLIQCIQSWTREVPVSDLVDSPLFSAVIRAFDATESFDAAVDCLCTMIRETRDVDETLAVIEKLYMEVIKLKPRIKTAADEEDSELFTGVGRVFIEAGETWVLLLARSPEHFRDLVEGILEISDRDTERDTVHHTFNFWYELKQYLTLEKYMNARLQYVDVYSKLLDILIKQLQYPIPENGNDSDLFEGDREAEDNFKSFRHKMGSVVKDCCEVIGVTECLKKPFELIRTWMSTHGSQATSTHVPGWQRLEAPIFAMRMMGRMVPEDENIMLPQLIPLLLQLPNHEKLCFQAVMTLGRYTKWTSQHPGALKPQLDYIMGAFVHSSEEVVRAAALSLRFFCEECVELLKDELPQIEHFYVNHLDKLPTDSQEELTEGTAAVIAKQPSAAIYGHMKACCDPILQSIKSKAQDGLTNRQIQLVIADKVKLLTLFVQWIRPEAASPQDQNPAVKYCIEIFPFLAELSTLYIEHMPVLEEICRCWRYMLISYRTDIAPLLPMLGNQLVNGFSASKQGAFLWASTAVVREFSAEPESQDAQTAAAIFAFYEQQATTFLRFLDAQASSLDQLQNVVEDFFRFAMDVLAGYANRAIPSELMEHIVQAAGACLTLQNQAAVEQVLRFLRDLLAYGMELSPTSDFGAEQPKTNPPEVQMAVKAILLKYGSELTTRVMAGLLYMFSEECFPDASGVLVDMFRLMPRDAAEWLKSTIAALPSGSISPQERERLLVNINQRIEANQIPKIRAMLQDFTISFRRRNVTPRDGLGRLEARRFSFSG